MTVAQMLLQRSRSRHWASPMSDSLERRHQSPPARHHRSPPALCLGPSSSGLCFMLALSIDLGKVSKDLITRVTHKLSCANSSYRLGKIQPCPVKVMAGAGFMRQFWSLWVKRFSRLFCPGALAPLAPSTLLTVEENKNTRLLTYSCHLSI